MSAITLTVGITTLPLNPDLYWTDEFGYSTVEKSVSRSLTGALLIQTAAKVGGRPITLAPEGDSSGWTDRTTLEQLLAWANTVGLQITMSLRGVSRTVEFRQNETAIEARPVVHFNDTDPGDYYLVTLRFMEV